MKKNRKQRKAEQALLRKRQKELLRSNLKIASVFIALDEAESIPRLAKSLKGFSEYNVLVDTGSTDDTIKVAKEHGFVVKEMKWPNHFAEARNKAVEIAEVDGYDWIAMFDADEILQNGLHLKQNLKMLPPDKDLVAIYHKTGVGHRFHRNCIWRPGQAKWKYRIHEHLLSTHGEKAITLNFEVLHPDAIGTEHNKKNTMELLAADAEEFTDNATRQYYYGRQLYYERRLDAIPILKHCSDISKWSAEAANALVLCGILYEGKVEKEKQGKNDPEEIARCRKKSCDIFRASVVKYPKLRNSYAGILRNSDDIKERIEAGMALLSIKESTFFDDNPKLYKPEYENWVKELIKHDSAEQIMINEGEVNVCK
jgi:glycosyltransferase involved in cell wall biosynthesis